MFLFQHPAAINSRETPLNKHINTHTRSPIICHLHSLFAYWNTTPSPLTPTPPPLPFTSSLHLLPSPLPPLTSPHSETVMDGLVVLILGTTNVSRCSGDGDGGSSGGSGGGRGWQGKFRLDEVTIFDFGAGVK